MTGSVTVLVMTEERKTYELGGWYDPEGRAEWSSAMRRLGRQTSWHSVEGQDDLPAGGLCVRLDRSEDGRLVCTGVMIGALIDGVEVTSRDLRGVRLGEVLAAVADFLTGSRANSNLERAIMKDYAKRLWVDLAGDFAGPPRRPGPKGWPDEHYERVAQTYREGLTLAPRSPVKYLTEQMHTSEATARRWIKTTRDKGMLGKAVPGKAGEQPQTKQSTKRGTKR